MKCMDTCIHLSKVVKTFRSGNGSGLIRAVDGIDLDVAQGEIVALLGPNGAGKTTALDMVLGFTQPDEGAIRVFGGAPKDAIRGGRVSAVLQTGGLLRDITITETLKLFASTHQSARAIDDVLEVAGLTGLAGQKVQTCSGGEQQRLRFAIALLGNPDVLILDEPTAGMDVEARRDFWSSMHTEASAGRTILFATHYLQEAEDFAPRTVLLDHGRIVADAPTHEIRAGGVQRTVSARFAPHVLNISQQQLAALPYVSGVRVNADRLIISTSNSDQVARTILDALDGHDLEIQHESLEDAFVALTTAGATA